jgi:hypothetical protein
MKFVNLKTLDVSTAWCWLRLLGFLSCENKKCYYTHGHEQAHNVRYRLKFIKRYFIFDYCTYQWIQLCEEDVIQLELLEKDPLKKGLGKSSYMDDEGNTMREYHSYCNDALKESIAPHNLPFGANLSVINFPEVE